MNYVINSNINLGDKIFVIGSFDNNYSYKLNFYDKFNKKSSVAYFSLFNIKENNDIKYIKTNYLVNIYKISNTGTPSSNELDDFVVNFLNK